MRKFLRVFLVFLLPIILMMYPLDLLISHQLKQTSACAGELEVWNDIYDGAINSDILIYGSSRAWRHINPEILEDSLELSVYNLGIDGHNFWLQYMRHLEYSKYNSKPEIIIISVDVMSLVKREDLFYYKQFLPYMLWNRNIAKYTLSYEGFSLADYYIPIIRYRHNISLEELSSPRTEVFRKKGYRGIAKSWNNDLANAKKEYNQYTAQLDMPSIVLFRNFIGECTTHGIEVIMVYTPEYYEGQAFVSNRDGIVELYQDIAGENDITFLNYSDEEICAHKQYFYNSMHLNESGSSVFSVTLAHDIKKMRN